MEKLFQVTRKPLWNLQGHLCEPNLRFNIDFDK